MYGKKNFFKKKYPSQKRKIPVTDVSVVETKPCHGFFNFKLYFPSENTVNLNILLPHLQICKDYLQSNKYSGNLTIIRIQKWFTIDYKIFNDEELNRKWTNLLGDVINNTEYVLNCFALAMNEIVCQDYLKENENNPTVLTETFYTTIGKIRAQIINVSPIISLKDVKVDVYGKLMCVKGTVIKASGAKIQCDYLAFSCGSCTGIQIVKQKDFLFTLPENCLSEGCKCYNSFTPLYSSNFTRTSTIQTLKIQELIGSDEYGSGRTPKTLECDLPEDLVNSCMPGDDITLTGILKLRKESNNIRAKKPELLSVYVETISIVNNKNMEHGSYGAAERIIFNTDDYYSIQRIHGEPMLFRYLVQSFCPSIFGHELVKAGLLLALFGGTQGNMARAKSHVLMVGDPGLGKSQMLKAATNVAPRGVYVCGNTSTGSGLTVTLSRESGGNFDLEAGALMLADQGTCCIDEFDKMPTQHASLLEAMEQQTISIAKSGVTGTLPSRTTILAAANPVGGHYDKSKTVAENLKLGTPMLSRFDLVFILLDDAGEERDRLLSAHILKMHTSSNNSTGATFAYQNTQTTEQNLKSRLQVKQNETLELLPHSLFRKYIAYAQRYVNPVLSEEAKAVLKTFYLDLRKRSKTGDTTPITRRQLQSLIRLTQARAKLELREECTEEDAMDVIEIMNRSLSDVYTNEAGGLDTTRSQNGTGMSRRNKAVNLLQNLQQLAKSKSEPNFSFREMQSLAEKIGVPKEKFEQILNTLNLQGYLLYKGSSTYELTSL